MDDGWVDDGWLMMDGRYKVVDNEEMNKYLLVKVN